MHGKFFSAFYTWGGVFITKYIILSTKKKGTVAHGILSDKNIQPCPYGRPLKADTRGRLYIYEEDVLCGSPFTIQT